MRKYVTTYSGGDRSGYAKTAKSAAIAALGHVVRKEYKRAVIWNRLTDRRIAEVDDYGGEMVLLTINVRKEFL